MHSSILILTQMIFTLGLFYCIDGCRLIQMDSKFQILGEGFHRQMQFSLNLSSIQRLIDCQIIYHYQIPAGAFLDVNALNRQFDQEKRRNPPKHCFTANNFDVEKPHGMIDRDMQQQLSPILFHSNKISSKSFTLNDHLEFPIHLRYHSPGNNHVEEFSTILFEQPRVFLRCDQNETILKELDCKQQIEKVPCACKQQKALCAALRLHSQKELTHLKVKIPIGNEQFLKFSIGATLTVVFICVFFVLRLICTKLPKSNNNKH